MAIKLKLSTLIDGFAALDHLCALYLTGKLNFRNSRTLDDARALVKTYDETRLGLLKQFAEEPPPGQSNWKFADAAKAKAYSDELSKVLDEEVEVWGEPYELDVDHEAVAQLSGKQIADLKWLITIVEPEETKQPEPEKAKKKEAKR